MKPASIVAVLIGSGIGVAVAIGGRGGPKSASPTPPTAVRPVSGPSVAEPARATLPQAVPAVANIDDFPVENDRPIASKEEFDAAAIACDEKDAGACRRAASAVELGTVVPKDLERAKTFRKVELTVLVRGCEKGAVDACLTLADRYLRGDGLAQNERTATALIEHAREICSRHPEAACRSVPNVP
jgi:hypothetical protein